MSELIIFGFLSRIRSVTADQGSGVLLQAAAVMERSVDGRHICTSADAGAVYLASGSVAAVVNAVLNPSRSTAKVLRQLADNNAQETLEKIRQLVGPPQDA